jgi:hypothetical protein
VAQGGGEVYVNEVRYRVDGEVGRFSFLTHRLERDGEVIFDSAHDLFPAVISKGWYLTRGFKEVAMVYGSVEKSYRKTATLINRVRYQTSGGTPMRTLQEQTEREGEKLAAHLAARTEEILESHGLDSIAASKGDKRCLGLIRPVQKSAPEVAAAIAECAEDHEVREEMRANPVGYEEPTGGVNISVDDVGVKRQKAQRKAIAGGVEAAEQSSRAASKTKFVHTTVAEVQTEPGRYVLSGSGVMKVLRRVLAFLLANGLTRRQVICFVDGQKSLHAALVQVFSYFRQWQVILDWYHLEKKCSQLTSLALKGKTVRNQVLDHLLTLLWDGRVESALKYLSELDPEWVKDAAPLEQLKGYLERSRPNIPCYSVRKQLGLRNSSNRGEKQNDLVVSERQKHNGMSWSETGSAALATLATAALNQEAQRWFQTAEVSFKLAA